VKKIILFLIVLSLTITFVQAGSTYNTPQIEVTLQSQSPDPVEPGQLVTVKFKIENAGKESAIDHIVKIVPSFPFSLYGDTAEKNIGKLRASSTGADAEIVEYVLKVDPAAIEGEAEIELMIKISEESWISFTDDEFLIDIQTHDAILDIVSVKSTPDPIPPGAEAEVQVLVKNLADSLLKDIKFYLDLSSSTMPFAPYQSSSERRISQLESDFQNTLSFRLKADPSAAPGLYKIPLNLTYNDEKGNAYHIQDLLALSIGEKPKLKVYIKKSTDYQDNVPAKVTVEIANAGTMDVKFLELQLLPSEDYQLLSTTDYFYLGDVDSDDTESEELDIFINKRLDTLNLPVLLKYYDANNQNYQQQVNLELPLYSSSQLKRFGLMEQSKALLYLGIILVAVGIFLYYRKKKKNNNNNK
jgi:LPXTG-motif cell wall-anchored protein